MLRVMLLLFAAGRVGAAAAGAAGALRVPSFISSDMVLQRGRATVWGWAAPHASVSVSVSARGGLLHSSRVVANATGAWAEYNVVQTEAAASTTVTISDGTSKIVLTNVAFGDVFLCSGQVRVVLLPAFNLLPLLEGA